MTPKKQITVMLVEDHPTVRKGLRALLNADGQFAVVGEAANGREAVALARKLRPEVILMDIAMPVLNGLQATRKIIAANPAARVIMLSAHSDDEYVESARVFGAVGYLEKQTSAGILAEAIRAVARGGTFFSPSIARRLLPDRRTPRTRDGRLKSRGPGLTARESAVLRLVTGGSANRQAAAILGISLKAVETHLGRLRGKLKIQESAGLVHWAIAAGDIENGVQLKIV